MAAASLEEMDILWNAAKAAEKGLKPAIFKGLRESDYGQNGIHHRRDIGIW